MSTIRFDSADGAIVVESEWDDTILDALLRSGAAVPFYCRAGLCGQCRSLVVSGEVEEMGVATQLLTPEQQQRGEVLLCRSRAATNCVIRPINAIASVQESAWPAVAAIGSTQLIEGGVLHLRVTAVDGATFAFRAGQYTRFNGADEGLADIQRLFIACAPGLPHLDFFLTPDMVTAPVRAALVPGREVSLAEPTGSASLRDGTQGHVLVITEGAGTASAIGILQAIGRAPAPAQMAVFMLGDGNGTLERIALNLAARAGVEAVVMPSAGQLQAALNGHLAARAGEPAFKTVAYVKAGRESTRLVREILLAYKVRPWDTHVENVAG